MLEDPEAVDLEAAAPAELGDRRPGRPREAAHVAQVVVVLGKDLLLGPDRGRLEQPPVLDRVDSELQHVVVLVRHRHPERDGRVRIAELRGREVVVEDQVGEAVAATALDLADVGRRVAEDPVRADVDEVDVGRRRSSASPVRLRRRPAERPVLDRVGGLRGGADRLDVVRHAVDGGNIDEARRVARRGDVVNAEMGAAERRRLGDLVGVSVRVGVVRRSGEQVGGGTALRGRKARHRDRQVAQRESGLARGPTARPRRTALRRKCRPRALEGHAALRPRRGVLAVAGARRARKRRRAEQRAGDEAGGEPVPDSARHGDWLIQGSLRFRDRDRRWAGDLRGRRLRPAASPYCSTCRRPKRCGSRSLN